jgi:deoxycytidine triphosphate deaminase
MIFSENTIQQRGFIEGATLKQFRHGSYDLTIHRLVTAEGELKDEFVLPPQGMVKVVSSEIIRLPTDVMGYVFVKTQLCNEGVLALNIGIVDPGFAGPLQSVLINFGKGAVRLKAGSVFSRISFQEIDHPQQGFTTSEVKSHEDVIDMVKKHTDLYMASTFLDVEGATSKAAEAAFSKYKKSLITWIPIVALALGFMTFGLNFGNMWLLQSYLKPQDQVRTELLAADIQLRMKKLEDENASLRKSIAPVVSGSKSNVNAEQK